MGRQPRSEPGCVLKDIHGLMAQLLGSVGLKHRAGRELAGGASKVGRTRVVDSVGLGPAQVGP